MGMALRLIRTRDPNYGAVKLREKGFSHVLFNLNIIATILASMSLNPLALEGAFIDAIHVFLELCARHQSSARLSALPLI
jgi:hypothetical protein